MGSILVITFQGSKVLPDCPDAEIYYVNYFGQKYKGSNYPKHNLYLRVTFVILNYVRSLTALVSDVLQIQVART